MISTKNLLIVIIIVLLAIVGYLTFGKKYPEPLPPSPKPLTLACDNLVISFLSLSDTLRIVPGVAVSAGGNFLGLSDSHGEINLSCCIIENIDLIFAHPLYDSLTYHFTDACNLYSVFVYLPDRGNPTDQLNNNLLSGHARNNFTSPFDILVTEASPASPTNVQRATVQLNQLYSFGLQNRFESILGFGSGMLHATINLSGLNDSTRIDVVMDNVMSQDSIR